MSDVGPRHLVAKKITLELFVSCYSCVTLVNINYLVLNLSIPLNLGKWITYSILSESMIVLSLWAMVRTVQSENSSRMARWIILSVLWQERDCTHDNNLCE